MSYEANTFIGKLEELSLSDLPLELPVVVGGLYSGGGSIDGGWHPHCTAAEGSGGSEKKRMEIVRVGDVAHLVLFAVSEEGVLWMGGNFSNGELQQEACTVQRQKYIRGSGISGKQSRGKWTDNLYFNASSLYVD